jgi:hypothetical protein
MRFFAAWAKQRLSEDTFLTSAGQWTDDGMIKVVARAKWAEEKPMHPKNAHTPSCSVDQPVRDGGPLPFGLPPHKTTSQLPRRAAMTILLVLSIGLWAAIWAALASLASATLG